jgi:hypothetical protein
MTADLDTLRAVEATIRKLQGERDSLGASLIELLEALGITVLDPGADAAVLCAEGGVRMLHEAAGAAKVAGFDEGDSLAHVIRTLHASALELATSRPPARPAGEGLGVLPEDDWPRGQSQDWLAAANTVTPEECRRIEEETGFAVEVEDRLHEELHRAVVENELRRLTSEDLTPGEQAEVEELRARAWLDECPQGECRSIIVSDGDHATQYQWDRRPLGGKTWEPGTN